MEYVIETFSLSKIFADWWGRNKVCAVDDLNLQIRQNEVFGLLGPNGSGKTTTIKMLLGLLHPTKGKALVFGGDSTNPKINSRIGFLPEESYLYKYLNARETLDFYARLFDIPSEVRKLRIESLLDMVGLRAAAGRAVGTYSKGMARRIGLAAALINDPDLLILDEPTTGLDPIGTRQIKDLILTLASRGKTILLSSHLLADVEDVCDRIAILYGGKIQAEGNVRDLLEQTDKTQITTSMLSSTAVSKIIELLKNESADYVIDSPMDKLETFFIKTIASAQQQQFETSGAVSTTKIGDFLAKSSGKEETSDLISSLVTETPPHVVPQSRPAVSARKTVDAVNQQLLENLTKQEQPAQAGTTPDNNQPQQPSPAEKIDENVLRQLTDQPKKTVKSDDDAEISNGASEDA